jgi:class 3 adenylate cyclase
MNRMTGLDHLPAERRLAAILAADVVGYSRLMGKDEVGTLRALKLMRGDVLDPLIASSRGRIVKTTGDGVLAEFASVLDAVSCAVTVQREMLELKERSRAQTALTLRIGVNIGDIIINGGDIFGDGVNVASRLEAICEPGGVAVSRAVHEQVRDKLALPFADLGEKTVKNIERPLRVFGLGPRALARLPETRVSAHREPPPDDRDERENDDADRKPARPPWKKWRLRLVLLIIASFILSRQPGVQHAFQNFLALVRTTPAGAPVSEGQKPVSKPAALTPLPPPIIVPSKPGSTEQPGAPGQQGAAEKPALAGAPDTTADQTPPSSPSPKPPESTDPPIGPPLELHPQQ